MADATTLARPYAKAVFETAHASSALGLWANALSVAAQAASHETVVHMISDPNVDNATLASLFQGPDASVPEGFANFLKLLIENDRLPVLPDIAEQFESLRAEAERTLAVTVRSASELSDNYKARMTQRLSERFKRDIALHCEVDDTMLGGAVIQAGDMVIDGSLKRKLNLMAEALKS